MLHVPDNYDLWKQHEAEQAEGMTKLPECSECGERIQDEDFFEFDGKYICPDCLENNHKRRVDDYEGI